MKTNAKCYENLRQYIETVPLIDCHDHSIGCSVKYTDPIAVVAGDGAYFVSDLISASSEKDVETMLNPNLPLEQRWPILQRAWKRTCHTGYAQVTKLVMKKFYNEDALTLDALKRIQGKLLDLTDEKVYDDILEEAKIKIRLTHAFFDMNGMWQTQCSELAGWVKAIRKGTAKLGPRSVLAAPITQFHSLRNYNWIQTIASAVDKEATTLEEYLDVCREIFEIYKGFGAVALKDNSAYQRSLAYDIFSQADAKKVFNRMVADPRYEPAYPAELKPLDDYLFHEFMRMAKEIDLPVQIHTGHMAWIRNDIVKTNAVLLTNLLDTHKDVRFDLFHANWPYSGELLFLAKNYPNVSIDFCWANIIDPIYCQRMFKQALSCVPHGKIHGYGADFKGCTDRAWAHAVIARDNIAIALADMVDAEYLNLDDAKEVAHAWLFKNANDFFRLDL